MYAKDKRTILTGKSTIARFLTRVNINSQSTLYEENTPAVKAQIDAVLDACRAFHKQPTNLNTLVNEAVKKSSTTPSSSSLLTSAGHLTLAEVMLWDLVKSGAWKSAASTVDVTAFINHLESTHPQFNQATQIITHALNHLPKLRVFKQAIATQVTSILAKEGHAAGCGYDVVFSTVNQNFKYTKDGDDFVLPIPRLGIKNVAPPLLAKSIVEKVKDDKKKLGDSN